MTMSSIFIAASPAPTPVTGTFYWMNEIDFEDMNIAYRVGVKYIIDIVQRSGIIDGIIVISEIYIYSEGSGKP